LIKDPGRKRGIRHEEKEYCPLNRSIKGEKNRKTLFVKKKKYSAGVHE